MHDITICRVYNPPTSKKGVWILVDKLWPRGLKKDHIPFDLWLKEIAPSTESRKSFHNDRTQWKDFSRRYIEELHHNKELIEKVLEMAKKSPITLFYAAKDNVHNHALVLQATLNSWPDVPEIE